LVSKSFSANKAIELFGALYEKSAHAQSDAKTIADAKK
jgi:hypothetical protein